MDEDEVGNWRLVPDICEVNKTLTPKILVVILSFLVLHSSTNQAISFLLMLGMQSVNKYTQVVPSGTALLSFL